MRGDRGKRLLRRRSELLEQPCAHLYETGGLRRAQMRGHANVLKRLFVHAGAFNLALWMRTLFGVGTPRTSTPEDALVIASERGSIRTSRRTGRTIAITLSPWLCEHF
jgi:hypothetical protein